MKSYMNALIPTSAGLDTLPLRVGAGVVFAAHGAQKLFGWFGGYGFEGTMNYFTGSVGLSYPIGLLVIIIEFFGPIALLLGFATRLWSLAIAIVMTGIIFTTFTDYFFMNWFGNQKSEGMEFFLLAIGMSASLVYSGAGRFSIDNLITKSRVSGFSSRLSLKEAA